MQPSRFVEQWVFLGQLDWVEFGIHGDQEALNRRGIRVTVCVFVK